MTNIYNLLVNQLRNLRLSDSQLNGIHKTTAVRERLPVLNLRLVHSVKQTADESEKLQRTKLYIKHMVTIRCKIILKAVLEDLGLHYSTVELGEVEIIGNFPDEKRGQLRSELLKYGLELMEDKKHILVERIKNVIIEQIHYEDESPNVKFSYFLSRKLNHSYTYLSNLFSEVKGMSIQHFIVLHKIERVKELIVYGELTLTEISLELHYSSVAHLSKQFKDVTGLTPSYFKNMKRKRRSTIDTI